MQKRCEIEEKYKWDLSSYIKDEAELKQNLKYLKENADKFKTYYGKLTDKQTLKEYLKLSISNKYNYKYFILKFKKSKSELIYTEESESFGGSSGFVRGVTNITMKEIAQIVGLVSFCKEANITEETLRKIVRNNYMYNFSVIEEILNARKSISEELNQDKYGMIELIHLYRYLCYNKKEQQKAELF